MKYIKNIEKYKNKKIFFECYYYDKINIYIIYYIILYNKNN